MKATAILLGNYDELMAAKEESDRLSLPNSKPVKPQAIEAEFFFRLDALSTMFVALDGSLKCQIAGITVHLKNESEVYNAIVVYLASR